MTAPESLPLPIDREAEESCIAAAMSLHEAALTVVDMLTVGDLWDISLGHCLTAIRAVLDAGRRPDQMSVAHELMAKGQLDDIGGTVYLRHICDKLAYPQGVEFWANKVREMAIRRRLISAAHSLQSAAHHSEEPTESLIATHEAAIAQVRISASLDDSDQGADEAVAERIENFLANPRAIRGLRTGWGHVDMLTDGLTAESLWLIAMATSVGKSLALQNLIRKLSLEGKPTLLFSTEMSAEAVRWRLAWMESGMDPMQIRERRIASDEEKQLIREAYARVREWPIRYRTRGGPTLQQIQSEVRRDKAKRGTEIVFVDHAGHVSAQGRDTKERMTKIAQGLKRVTMDEGVCVVAAAHVNREATKGVDWVRLINLADSSDLEKEADVVILGTPCELDEATGNDRALEDRAFKKVVSDTGRGRVMFDVAKSRPGTLGGAPMMLTWYDFYLTGGGRFTVAK